MSLEHGNLLDGLVRARSLTGTGRDKLVALAVQLAKEGQMSTSQDTQLDPEVIITPENLDAILELQIQRLIELKFHEALGMTEEEYRSGIPSILPQPETYIGRFDIPLVVEPRIDFTKQHQAAGVTNHIRIEKFNNVTEVPSTPYTLWTHDANRYRLLSVKQTRSIFLPDEVGSPMVEVIALYLQYPEIFEDHGVNAAGSRYGDDYVPDLSTFDGGPKVDAHWIDDRYSSWGVLSRGNEINVGA